MSKPLEESKIDSIAESIIKLAKRPIFQYRKNNKPFIMTEKNYICIIGNICLMLRKDQQKFQEVFDYVKKHNCENINLIINSPGGSVKDKDRVLEYINKSPVPIDCIIIGKCASAAIEIALECRNISIYYKSKVGIHYPINIQYDEDGKEVLKETNDQNQIKYYQEYFSRKFNISEKEADTLLKESKYLNVDQAIKYNFITNIFYELPEIYLRFKNTLMSKIEYQHISKKI